MYSSTDTSVVLPIGAKMNLLALDSGSWTDPTTLFSSLTESFTPAGATLVASWYSDNSGGVEPGTSGTAFTYTYSGGFNVGDALMLVVYPTLTIASASPGNNTTGFYFRTDAIIDGSDMAWVAPADGGTFALNAYTTNLSGTLPDNQFTAGAGATGGNGFTTIAVPEPSPRLLTLGGLVVMALMRRRRRE